MAHEMMHNETELRLLSNDPTVTDVTLGPAVGTATAPSVPLEAGEISSARDVRRGIAALCQSTHVSKLVVSLDWLNPFTSTLDVNSIRGAAVEQLGHWIADSPALDSLHLLVSAGLETRELQNVVVQCFARFLQWKRERGSIKLKSLSLCNIDVDAEVIVALLRENPHLTTFSMTSCCPRHGSFATEAIAAAHVAQSLVSNASMSSLTLDANFRNEVYFSAILEALAIGESSVETLALHFNNLSGGVTTLQAITNFFDALAARFHDGGSCSNGGGRCCLRAVHFRGFHWTVDLLAPLVTSIRAATTPSTSNAFSSIQLEEIGMHSCVIDHFAMVSLSSLFAVVHDDYRTTIHTLSITESRLFDAPDATQSLVGMSPGLQNLHLPFLVTFARGRGPFHDVMCGLELLSCAVQTLSLSTLWDMNLDALLEAMPNFRSVKSISFDLLRCRGSYRKRLLKAFRNNRSIVHSNITNDNLDASDRQRLQAYHDRNRYLALTIRAEAMAKAMASTESRQAEYGPNMAQLGSLLPPLFLECDSSVAGSVFGAMVRVELEVGPETTGSE